LQFEIFAWIKESPSPPAPKVRNASAWLPCEAIAWRLGIRSTTVHKHMHRIYAKTGARERGELHAIALRLAAQRSDAGRERLAA
jgi:hypothetical protein